MIMVHPHRFVFRHVGASISKVTVCVSLYNFRAYIVEALQSVYAQTGSVLDLVVVEDCSTNDSLAVAEEWMRSHQSRFNSISLVQHSNNRGLSAARNTAISVSSTPYIFVLDADNMLYPRCVDRCIAALEADAQAAVAYPIIEKCGVTAELIGNVVWIRDRFKRVNCVDAMSLIRREALAEVGGYSELTAIGRLGWEDYELWCKFVDKGFNGVQVPEILARYRTHKTSMLNSISNQEGNINRLHKEMMSLHSWLEMPVA